MIFLLFSETFIATNLPRIVFMSTKILFLPGFENDILLRPRMPDKPIKLLYIVGSGRSGSTILGNVLDQADGVFHAGELRGMWKYALMPGSLCGCGRPITACEIWASVYSGLFQGEAAFDPETAWQEREWANKAAQKLRLLLPGGRAYVADHISTYLAGQARMYGLLAAASESRVIVDSSKLPVLGLLAQMTTGVEVYFLHLVRQPEAVAVSWRRKKQLKGFELDEHLMSRHSPVRSAVDWSVRNWYVVRLRLFFKERYRLLRYEDFTAQPEGTIKGVLRWLGEGGSAVPFASPNKVILNPVHTMIGNPNRFTSGEVTIRLDAAWKQEIGSRERLIVRLFTFPFLKRFGYRD
jgi:hypothetical protein